MLVAARAGQILADLGIAVGHEDTSDPRVIAVGKDGEFFPPGRRRKAVEVEDRDAVYGDFADLDHAPQIDQGLVVDLILSQQFGVVAEVAQEPAQLPHCLWLCSTGGRS